MLLDAERGRPIELDALVTVVHELGQRTGVATPNIDALLGLTRLLRPVARALSGGQRLELVGAQDGPLIGLLDEHGHALVGLEAVGRHGPLLAPRRPSGSTTSKRRTTLKFSSRRPSFSPRSTGVEWRRS